MTKFLKNPRGVKEIILITNQLDAYWRGYGFKIKSIGYIVVGPGAAKNNGELARHEFLHVLTPTLRLPQYLITQTQGLLAVARFLQSNPY